MNEPTRETKPRVFVFVLMPFHRSFKDIYEVGIKPACERAGAYCERVDEQVYDGSILARIYNQIAKADVIVADMTDHNSNVFYETGYAHALNKRVILLTQNADDIPFDLKHEPHIVYSGAGKIASLKAQLEPRIRWYIENPQGAMPAPDLMQVSVNGVLLRDKPTVDGPMVVFSHSSGGSYSATLYLSVAIQNIANQILKPDSFSLALIVPDALEAAKLGYGKGLNFRSMTRLTDGRKMYSLPAVNALFPQDWETVTIQMKTQKQSFAQLHPEMTIRLFTEVGPRDYPFILKPRIEERDDF